MNEERIPLERTYMFSGDIKSLRELTKDLRSQIESLKYKSNRDIREEFEIFEDTERTYSVRIEQVKITLTNLFSGAALEYTTIGNINGRDSANSYYIVRSLDPLIRRASEQHEFSRVEKCVYGLPISILYAKEHSADTFIH